MQVGGDRHGKLVYLANDGRTATTTLYRWTREAPLITPYFRLEAGQDLRLADLLRNLVVVRVGARARRLKHLGHRQRDLERLRQPRRAAQQIPGRRVAPAPWQRSGGAARQRQARSARHKPQLQEFFACDSHAFLHVFASTSQRSPSPNLRPLTLLLGNDKGALVCLLV
jgi:hypothetical protein